EPPDPSTGTQAQPAKPRPPHCPRRRHMNPPELSDPTATVTTTTTTQHPASTRRGAVCNPMFHAGRPDIAQHGRDPGAGQDRVERGGEVRAAVADHELDLVCLLAEVHQQVACLLGGPPAGGMLGDSENADAPAGVLDHGQDVSL